MYTISPPAVDILFGPLCEATVIGETDWNVPGGVAGFDEIYNKRVAGRRVAHENGYGVADIVVDIPVGVNDRDSKHRGIDMGRVAARDDVIRRASKGQMRRRQCNGGIATQGHDGAVGDRRFIES